MKQFRKDHYDDLDAASIYAEAVDYDDEGADYDYASDTIEDDYDDEELVDYEGEYADFGYELTEEAEAEIAEIQDMLDESLEELSPEEVREFYGEFWGALASAIPAVISAAPSIIKGIGGLFKGKRRRGRPAPRRRSTPRPTPRRSGGGTDPGIAMLNQKLDRLISLLSRRQ